MPTDEHTLERLRLAMKESKARWQEKKMFGGDCFMVDDKMCFGTYRDGLMVRIDPEDVKTLTQRAGASQMIHGGRPMTGYLFIEPDGYDKDADLRFWVQKCLDFNPKAKASKK